MKLFGGLIGWRANKQNTVTTSTTEAELLALSQTAKEAMYMSLLFNELEISLDSKRIRIQCDNAQTVRLVTREIATLKTQLRHVDIQNHWLRQEVDANQIAVEHTPSAELMADGLTKALQGPKFSKFREQLNLIDISSTLQQRRPPEVTPEEVIEQTERLMDESFRALEER